MPRWNQTTAERLAARLIKTPGGCCWWVGMTDRDGYGRLDYEGQCRPAHRVMLMSLGEDVTDLDVDHLCRNRRCVNPLHLDIVTRAENNRRQWIARGHVQRDTRVLKTHCKWGHELNEVNTYIAPNGHRNCRPCNRANQRRSAERKRAQQTTPTTETRESAGESES